MEQAACWWSWSGGSGPLKAQAGRCLKTACADCCSPGCSTEAACACVQLWSCHCWSMHAGQGQGLQAFGWQARHPDAALHAGGHVHAPPEDHRDGCGPRALQWKGQSPAQSPRSALGTSLCRATTQQREELLAHKGGQTCKRVQRFSHHCHAELAPSLAAHPKEAPCLLLGMSS